MSSGIKRKSFSFTWILENISFCWQEENESIRSPRFVISAPQEVKFYLTFLPRGSGDGKYVDFYLGSEGDLTMKIDSELALLSKDGSVLTSMEKQNLACSGFFSNFKEINEIFVVNRSAYLPEDKLTVRCRIWQTEGEMAEDVQWFGRTRICIKREAFLWNIRNFSSLSSEHKRTYQIKSVLDNEVLMSFNLFLKNPYTDQDSITIQLVAENGKIKNFELHLIPLNCFEKENKGIRKNFIFSESEKQKLLTLPFSKSDLTENKNLWLPNDLFFRCECTFSTGVIFEEIESVVYDCGGFATSDLDSHCMDDENTLSMSKRILNENLNSLFQDSILSDVKLKVSTKTFFAHKSILSARSPVFKAMFENDMKEKLTECVDIEDLDSDTLYRMLQYVYTAEIKDLQWENACELYRAADKYDILALRDECSAYLKTNLCLSNACETLIHADTHQDADLKISAQNFVFDHDIMNSEKWKLLMETHLKLASDTMYLQIQRKPLNNKLNSLSITPAFDTNTAETSFAPLELNVSQPQSSNKFSSFVPEFHSRQFNFGAVATDPGPFMFSVPCSTGSTAPRKISKAMRRSPRKD